MRRRGWMLAWISVVFVSSPEDAAAGAKAPVTESAVQSFQGLSLTEALLVLKSAGLQIVFSSQLVLPEMRVEREPRGGSASEVLAEILAPHGLRAVAATGGRLVVVRAPPVRPPQPQPDRPTVRPAEDVPRFEEEILVTPSHSATDGTSAPQSLRAADLVGRASVAGDPLQALGGLPGAALGEGSSRVHVRGGRDDDVLILLDGLELLAPYHLQEFNSALSIVTPTSLDRVDLLPSGYPAQYGDRMGGVLDLVTASEREGKGSLGLGLTHLDVEASGPYSAEQGSWYLAGRGGSYRLVLEMGGREDSPRFWDLFGKTDYRFGPRHSLRLSSLVAEDALAIEPWTSSLEAYGGDWNSQYVWLTDQWFLGSGLEAETIVSLGEIERDRFARLDSSPAAYSVRDRRSLQLASAKQIWRYERSAALAVEGGAEIREMSARIDYANERRLDGPLTPLRTNPGVGRSEFVGRFDYTQGSAFSTVRSRLGAFSGEFGLRYEFDRLSGEEHVSPRTAIAWSLAPGLVARASWGWYYQTQRPNELQVEDDETLLQRAERAEHTNLQLRWSRSAKASLRIEAFQRRTGRSRARFVNVFDSTSFFPELDGDRIRIAPDRGSAEGIELGYQGQRDRASWRLAYTYAKSADRLDGRWVPRALDQRHAVSAGWAYRGPRGWSCDLAWTYRSGWPTTEISLDAAGRATLGPLNGERLPEYHRLDARVGKTWQLSHGTLAVHLDLLNVYDRDNVRGRTDFRLVPNGPGEPRLESRTTHWNGRFPSFGLRWSF